MKLVIVPITTEAVPQCDGSRNCYQATEFEFSIKVEDKETLYVGSFCKDHLQSNLHDCVDALHSEMEDDTVISDDVIRIHGVELHRRYAQRADGVYIADIHPEQKTKPCSVCGGELGEHNWEIHVAEMRSQ